MSAHDSPCGKKRARAGVRQFQRLLGANGASLAESDTESSASDGDDEGLAHGDYLHGQPLAKQGAVFRQHVKHAHSDRVTCVTMGVVPAMPAMPASLTQRSLVTVTASMDGSIKLWSREVTAVDQDAAASASDACRWGVVASHECGIDAAHVSALLLVDIRPDRNTHATTTTDGSGCTKTHLVLGFTDASIEIWHVCGSGWEWERSIWSTQASAITSLDYDTFTGTLAASRLDGVVQLWDMIDDRKDELTFDHDDEVVVSCAFWRHTGADIRESQQVLAERIDRAHDSESGATAASNSDEHRIDDESLYLVTLAEDGAVAVWSTHSCERVFEIDVSTERYGEARSVQVATSATQEGKHQRQQRIVITFSRFVVVFVCQDGPESPWTLHRVLDPRTMTSVEVMDARLRFGRPAPPAVGMFNVIQVPRQDAATSSECPSGSVALVLACKNRIGVSGHWFSDDEDESTEHQSQSRDCHRIEREVSSLDQTPEQWITCVDVSFESSNSVGRLICCSGHRHGGVRFWEMRDLLAASDLLTSPRGTHGDDRPSGELKEVGGLCEQLTQRLAVGGSAKECSAESVSSGSVKRMTPA